MLTFGMNMVPHMGSGRYGEILSTHSEEMWENESTRRSMAFFLLSQRSQRQPA